MRGLVCCKRASSGFPADTNSVSTNPSASAAGTRPASSSFKKSRLAKVGMTDKQTLLIVEDEPNLAEILNEYFCSQGYHVLMAERGEDALQTGAQRLPHLVL